jgi:hypothetical protein
MITHKGLLYLGFSKDDFVLQDDSDGKGVYVKEWNSDKPQPSAEEMKTATDFIKAQEIAQEYAYNRKADYPPIGDQLDALWKGGADADAMKIIVNQVKDKYPK